MLPSIESNRPIAVLPRGDLSSTALTGEGSNSATARSEHRRAVGLLSHFATALDRFISLTSIRH